MAGSPDFKIYRGKEYIGCVKYLEDAAAVVSLGAKPAYVKLGHGKIIWREGEEEFSAGESYDRAADVMNERIKKIQLESYRKAFGRDPEPK